MIANLFSLTQQEFLFAIAYGSVMMAGVYISLKQNVQPVFTLLLILTCSIVYLIITNITQTSIQQYLSDDGSSRSAIILLGIFGALIAVKLLKKLFRIPALIIHNILVILLIFFSFFQVNEYLKSSQHLSYLIFNFPISNGVGSLDIYTLQQSASLYPELFINNTVFFELLIAILVTLTYLFFTAKFKYPGNSLLFTILMLLVLFFISLFKVNPAELPALSDRLLGLNVVQWALVLTGILLFAYILSKEMDTSRRRREILKKAPSEYTLLIIYLIFTLISFQTTSLFSDIEIKILLIGYFVTTSFMVSYFLKKVEKYYLRYGTVSIILLTCILFIHSNINVSEPAEINDFDKINTPQILIDKSIINDKNNLDLKTNVIGSNSTELIDINDPIYLISSSNQMTYNAELMIGEFIESNP